jgi:transcriptional regulator with XRE-family HTH domain
MLSSYSCADGVAVSGHTRLMAETGFGKRLRQARELRGLSQDEIGAASGGVSRAAVAQWEKGTSAPTMDKMEALCGVLDADPVWLITGAHGKWGKNAREIGTGVGVATVGIPEYDVRAAMGGGFVVSEESQRDVWPFSRRYIEDELRLPTNHLVVLEAVGDSMEPTLRSGDRVLVNMADKRVSQPGIFVLWDGDGTVVKRLELVPNTKPKKLRRISDNPLHGTYDVPAAETIIVGRVVWYARRM